MKILHFADLHLGVENYGRLDPATGLLLAEPAVKKHRKVGEKGWKDPKQWNQLVGEVNKFAAEAMSDPRGIPNDQWGEMPSPDELIKSPNGPEQENEFVRKRKERDEMLRNRKSALRAGLYPED